MYEPTKIVTDQVRGVKTWMMGDLIHRVNGPARLWDDGTEEWWFGGKLHRKYFPAVTFKSGTKYWYLNGVLHNWNGPACQWSDGNKSYYLDGKNISYKDWVKITRGIFVAEYKNKLVLKKYVTSDVCKVTIPLNQKNKLKNPPYETKYILDSSLKNSKKYEDISNKISISNLDGDKKFNLLYSYITGNIHKVTIEGLL